MELHFAAICVYEEWSRGIDVKCVGTVLCFFVWHFLFLGLVAHAHAVYVVEVLLVDLSCVSLIINIVDVKVLFIFLEIQNANVSRVFLREGELRSHLFLSVKIAV